MTIQQTAAGATALRMFSSTSMQSSLRELIPRFERESGNLVGKQP